MYSYSLRSWLILSLVSIVSLTGCKSTPPPVIIPSMLAADTHTTNGVQAVQQGSRFLVVLFTDVFFEPLSTELQLDRIAQLRHTAHFVYGYAMLYPYASVEVRGYTDQLIPPYSQHYLSQQYAEVVAAYLWDAGIPRDRLHAVGLASSYPIASQETVTGMGYNRRVEIQIN